MARNKLSADLATSVLKLIHHEQLGAGDRLPAVRSLADTHAVAQPTMREALRLLEARGVVEFRHGSGIYIRENADRMVLANPAPFGLDPRAIRELLEARQLIEPALAERAARHMDEQQLDELTRLLDEAGEHLEHEDDALHPVNMDFHRQIARLSGHRLLAQVIDTLLELYGGEQRVILALHGDRVRDHVQHLAVLDALRARDPAAARERMEDHLRDVMSLVQQRLDAA